jgi:large subunit ribosomal protein L3
MAWILARKIEMTRIVKNDAFVPVTLLSVPTLKVVAVKSLDKDGYNAVVVWILSKWKTWELKWEKQALSHNEFDEIKEFSVSDISLYTVWQEITLDVLDGITEVRIEGISKGHGFTWAMKRWNFHWGCASHGSKFHRALGSIGTRKPRRTKPGQKMHGHMWDEKVTLKKVSLELVNKEIGVIWVRWGVPGSRNSLVHIIF